MKGTNDYTAGDLVPMRGCLYKLSFSSTSGTDVSTKYYNIERLKLDIMYNYTLGLKENRIYVDHTITNGLTGRDSIDDFNEGGEEINYYPGWAGFYFVSRGYLTIIWDNTSGIIDTYYGCSAVAADGSCSTVITTTDRDTCATGNELFPTASAMSIE